jgi:DNA helicase HerA-like ATPase
MSQTDLSNVCRVSSVSQDLIQIEVIDTAEFKNQTGRRLTIGSHLHISDDDGHSVIAIVQAYRIKDPLSSVFQLTSSGSSFILDAQPVGFLTPDGEFRRGGQEIAIPPSKVSVAGPEILRAIYIAKGQSHLTIGNLAQDEAINVPIDGDLFFGKHIAVVGSTGSGKSCSVARILQEGIRPSDKQKTGGLNNSHIVVFDLHGEYASAFPTATVLNVNNLRLPYWLMNAEELEEMFIMSNEHNSHNQVSQFRHAVVENKRRHNPSMTKVSYDSPVYFSLEEVYRFICNMNAEVVGKKPGEGMPVLAAGRTQIVRREDKYFTEELTFCEPSTSKEEKASKGPFNGEFDRFCLRLRTVIDDERLSFLLKPRKTGNLEFKTEDLEEIIADILGYRKNETTNITIVDLSGIPFEVTSLVVSLMSRIIFDVGFYLKRTQAVQTKNTTIPILAVYEEAHIYAPDSELSRFRSVTRSIERIAKEGRKYGICLMIVSQRPSEIAETIFSQCNNFVVMRLTNPADQNYVKRLLPDSVAGLTNSLPTLEQREALVLGDAIAVPTIVRISDIEHKPNSHDIPVLTEWRDDWRTLPFATVLDGMKRR